MRTIGLAILMLVGSSLFAQTSHGLLRRADRAYDKGSYEDAELNYRKGLQQDGYNPDLQYNLGNTLYKQQRFDEAAKQYGEVADRSKEPKLKADALFNQGNAYFEQQQFEQAVESYKKALRNRPADLDAKRNLAMALQQVKVQQQQQSKGDEDKQEPQDAPPQDDPNKPQDDENGQPKPQNQPQDTPPADAQQSMKRREAEQMLDIIDNEEAKVQQKLRKGKGKPSKSNKDW